LRESFTFYKNFGDQAQLRRGNFNIPWASIKMTNNLPSGTYTALFKIFLATVTSDGNFTFLNRELLIQVPDGDYNYKIVTFSHDFQTTHSTEFIQFTSNGRPGEITFQFRFYGSEYNNLSLRFLFYSRVVSGKEGYAFDHKIFYVDQVQLRNQILYFDDINMNDNKIKGLAEPNECSHESNKKFVDDLEKGLLKLDGSRAMAGNLKMGDHTITGIRSSSADNAALTVGASKSLYLPISGIRGMQGDLNMDKFTIVNLKSFVENESAKPAQDNEVINFGYFSNQRGLLKTLINNVASAALNRKNPGPVLSPINMGKNFITNAKEPLPSNSNNAFTVNFINKTVSDNNTSIGALIDKKIKESEDLDIKGNNEENVFSFVMDDDLLKKTTLTLLK